MTPRLPYFGSQKHADALLSQLHLWQGTRWQHAGARPNEMKCGVSGDCLFWVHAFKAIGALPTRLEIPDYRLREALADRMHTLREKIEATGCAQLVWERPQCCDRKPLSGDPFEHLFLPWLLIGDVLIFKNGTSGAHCGLMVKAVPIHFAHLTGNGLLEEPLHQKHYLSALTFVYRLLEAEEGQGPNVQHSTSNAQRPTARAASESIGEFNVGRSMLDVGSSGVSR
jgi:cell wall-associated NlpC family hydrolase